MHNEYDLLVNTEFYRKLAEHFNFTRNIKPDELFEELTSYKPEDIEKALEMEGVLDNTREYLDDVLHERDVLQDEKEELQETIDKLEEHIRELERREDEGTTKEMVS